MLTCGDASVADGDAENKDKARDLVDLESSNNNAKVREGVAPPRFCFCFPPRAESGPGSSPPPPPFPVRPPRGGRTPRGNGGPQSGFVGQNLVFWIIALCFRKLGPGFRKPSAGPVAVPPRRPPGPWRPGGLPGWQGMDLRAGSWLGGALLPINGPHGAPRGTLRTFGGPSIGRCGGFRASLGP